MTVELPRELNILVERVVRPLPIPLARQRRLRTEFLEHLQTIYAEELARDGEPAAAQARTQDRFGDPAELTAELRGTVRWPERWAYWLQLRLEQRAGESTAFYVVRMMTIFVSFLLSWVGLMMADHHLFGTERASLLKIQVSLAAVTFLAVWLGGLLMFGLQMGDEWNRPRRRWSRIAAYCLGMIAAWPASLALMMFIAEGTWSDYSMPFVGSVVGGLVTVAMGTVVGVLHRRDTDYRREWAALEIATA